MTVRLATVTGTPRTARRVPNIHKAWKFVLRRMAFSHDAYDDENFAELLAIRDEIEGFVAQAGPEGAQPDEKTRATRGWLRYFGRRDRYDAYRAAVARAQPSIVDAIHERWPCASLWICFQPVRGLLQLQVKDGRVRLILPTPTFLFDERGFALVVNALVDRQERRALRAALQAPACQAIQAELDALGAEGLAEPVAPVRDLKA